MGTRADFYVGRGTTAEWLGSIAWDGYPQGIGTNVLRAKTERTYRKQVAAFLAERRDRTLPVEGWPWPWENSQTTDYAYAFDAGVVYGSCFGHAWFVATKEPEDHSDDKPTEFPAMKTDRAAFSGPRSGLIVLTPRGVI